MRKQYVAALDQGTTGTRCSIYDLSGNTIGWSYRKHEQFYPHEGWVEQDPVEILRNSQFVIAEALEKSGISRNEIATLGITNQRETVIVWNRRTGIPLHKAIVWQDNRTSDITLELKAQHGQELVREKTGLIISPYFSASKFRWLQDHSDKFSDAVRTGDALAGTMDTWLIWNLTGGKEYSTDYTNASRTMLMDIRKLAWDPELPDFFGLKRLALPEIKTSMNSDGFGVIRKGALEGVDINSDLGDQQAALVGEKCLREGDTKITYGTGSFVLQNTGKFLNMANDGLLATCAYGDVNGGCTYAIEGSTEIAGSLYDWLKTMGIFESFNEIDDVLRNWTDSSLFLVPAFNGLYSPHWDETARGLIIGLTNKTARSDILRAASEAICFQVRDMVEAMPEAEGMLKVDGGSSVNNSLMQLQSNVLGRVIHRQKETQATALGAGFAAGIASGLWSEDDVMNLDYEVDTFMPSEDRELRERKYRGWKKAVERSRNWYEE